MREIKFRVYNVLRNKYINLKDKIIVFYDYNEWVVQDEFNEYHEEEVYAYSCNNDILEQFTGLTDKNGVEIYEGDVLQGIATGGSESYNDLILRVYQGVDGAFRYEIKHKEKWKRSAYQTIHSLVSDKTKKYYNVKVIGNIHE